MMVDSKNISLYEYAQTAWAEMVIESSLVSTATVSLRGRRQMDNAECNCGPQSNSCPPGLQGTFREISSLMCVSPHISALLCLYQPPIAITDLFSKTEGHLFVGGYDSLSAVS